MKTLSTWVNILKVNLRYKLIKINFSGGIIKFLLLSYKIFVGLGFSYPALNDIFGINDF